MNPLSYLPNERLYLLAIWYSIIPIDMNQFFQTNSRKGQLYLAAIESHCGIVTVLSHVIMLRIGIGKVQRNHPLPLLQWPAPSTGLTRRGFT